MRVTLNEERPSIEAGNVSLWWANCLTCWKRVVVDVTDSGMAEIRQFLTIHDPTNHATEVFVGDEPCPFCD